MGYVFERHPRFSETLAVDEFLAHEAAGQEIGVFAPRPVEEAHHQDMLGRVRAPVTRIRDRFSGPGAFWERLVSAREVLPRSWRVLARAGGVADGQDAAQALDLAVEASRRGATHLHAHFGTVATAVARLAAAMAGIGHGFTAHAEDFRHAHEEPQHLNLELRDADVAVTASDHNLVHLRGRHGAGRVGGVHDGLDLARFSHAPPADGASGVLAVGRLVEKGFHVLIEAVGLMAGAGRAPDCRVMGSGEEEAGLARQIEDAGLGGLVRLEGARPRSEVIETMRGAAVWPAPASWAPTATATGFPPCWWWRWRSAGRWSRPTWWASPGSCATARRR